MPLTPHEMDVLMDRHFEFEMADDVDGVLTTLAPDAQHDIVGAPEGPTVGIAATRPTYEQVFADLAGERVETLHRYYGENCLTDESLWVGRAAGSPLGSPASIVHFASGSSTSCSSTTTASSPARTSGSTTRRSPHN